jgi:tetratricopeptide (TPR) repeat protein
MEDTQLHRDEERAQIVEQDDFAPLVRALRRAQGFALYFVECNVPAYRRTVAGVVREHLERPVVDVDLAGVDRSRERPSIDHVLDQQLEDAPDEAVAFVWALEWLLPTSEVDQDIRKQTLKEVNWRREAYARLDRPVVVWLPEYAVRYLARNAPDFFDWNSGLYVFETPASERPDLLDTSLDALEEKGSADDLSTEEKRRREAYLKSLLAEYDGDSDFDRDARADILLRLVELHRERASYDPARSCAQKALDISRTIEDRKAESRARHEMAMIAAEQGDYEEARRAFERVLEIDQQIGNRPGEATTRHQLATIALEQGYYEEARSEFEETLRTRQEIGDRSGEATTRHGLATIALRQGDYEEARSEFEEVLRIVREISDRRGEATTRHQLATIALQQGNYDEAQKEFAKALQTYHQIGDRRGEATTRHQLATIALEQGDYEKARKEFEQSLSIKQQIGDRAGEATTRHQLASVASGQGNYEEAQTEFEEALLICQEIGDQAGEAMALGQLGILAANELGRLEEGLRLLYVSYDILTSIGHAQAEEVEPWIGGLAEELGYDEDELAGDVEYARQSYAEDQGWSLIQQAFSDANPPQDQSFTD